MIVEDHVVDADATAGFASLGATAGGQHAAALGLMAGVTIGDSDEAHAVTGSDPLRRRAGSADVAVVRVRAERNDVELRLLRVHRRRQRRADAHRSHRDQAPD